MYVWKITLEAGNGWGPSTYCYAGVASSAKVAVSQVMRASKRDKLQNRRIKAVERIGELDFCTK